MSGRRPLKTPYPVIRDGDMSGSITSEVTIIQTLSMVSFDIAWDGNAPEGEMIVEISNSYELNEAGEPKVTGNWNPLPMSETPTVTGDTDNGFIDVLCSAGYAIRIRYERTSGDGTMNVKVFAKVA